jgi:membrane protease YdiL (CAAX protease family)
VSELAVAPTRTSRRTATLVGLALTLSMQLWIVYPNRGVRALLPGSDRPQLIHKIGSQLINDWLFVGILLVIVLRWERLPVRSIGWKRLERRDLYWIAPLWVVLIAASALQGSRLAENRPVQTIFSLPVWFRVLMVITAPITEEIIYRGYTLERLTTLLGNVWLAGLITWIGFTAAHVPFFGVRQALFGTAPGVALITLLYIRRRSLPAVILLHFLLDLPILLPASVVRG